MDDRPKGAFGYQDPQGLAAGLPLSAFGIRDALQAGGNGIRNALSPIGWALHYPDRVLERFGYLSSKPPMQMDPMYRRMRQVGEERWEPGARESSNVEDRRPTSPWQFW